MNKKRPESVRKYGISKKPSGSFQILPGETQDLQFDFSDLKEEEKKQSEEEQVRPS